MRYIIFVCKWILYSPHCLFLYFLYLFSKNRSLIDMDLQRYHGHFKNTFLKLSYLFVFHERCFRNVLYYRLLKNIKGGGNPTLHIETPSIGGGLLVVHGDSTYIYAKSIGRNLYVNQCVTIGNVGDKSPIIGDNVRIATGAIVIGGISIGDNSTIGAGAVVVKDVPSNCVVVGNPARIVKQNGTKVDIKL